MGVRNQTSTEDELEKGKRRSELTSRDSEPGDEVVDDGPDKGLRLEGGGEEAVQGDGRGDG